MTEQESRLNDVYLKLGAKEARRQYQREWNRKNPEKRRGYLQRYWEKKAREQFFRNDGAI